MSMTTMDRTLCHVILLSVLLVLPAAGRAEPADREGLKLFIGGGGAMAGLVDAFRELAGPQARLVVILGGTDQPDLEAHRQRWQARGFEDVFVLHTDDKSVAASPEFARPLESASAVWIGGGLQQNLAELYVDTPVETQLIRLLKRGGTIGGSSAGAAIQTKAMLFGGTVQPQVGRGFDLLPGAIVDQHFLKRNRLRRLIDAIRRHPELIGYGIDEGTALIANRGKLRVVGRSYVLRVQVVDGALQIDAFQDGDEFPMPGDEP
jgi:cyanophycinase